MEENQNLGPDEEEINFPKLIENIKNYDIPEMDKEEIKQFFSHLEADNANNELFRKSVKKLFDMGFDIAQNLNLEMLLEMFEKKPKKEK